MLAHKSLYFSPVFFSTIVFFSAHRAAENAWMNRASSTGAYTVFFNSRIIDNRKEVVSWWAKRKRCKGS